ncbi:MAG: ABC transporter substrate-binding protein [Clostridiales bacterium]|nr:ABC transporter substrate-binding protein [Clostridiales bacterium]
MSKRIGCLLLCLLMLPTLAMAENVEDAIVIGMISTRTTEIRPLMPSERDMISLYGMVYESLVVIDDNGIPQPSLAESWSEASSGKTWTFVLRENVVFSDGTPLTAQDVVASCQYILDMAKNEELTDKGFYQNMKYLVSAISVVDERTIEVKAGRSYYGFLYSMTFPVVPASQVDMASPLGTGPYVISSFEPVSYMWLVSNENWWQNKPQVEQITVNFYTNNKTLITDYEYSQVDAAFTRSVAAAQYKSGINSLSIPYTTRQLETLLLHHKEFPLDSAKVRQAITLAINKASIAKNVYMGMTINADTPVPSDGWLYNDDLESSFVYNPEKAAALLEEDGWTDPDGDGQLNKVVDGKTKNFVLRLIVYEDPDNDVRFEAANMIKDMLKVVGIDVNVEQVTYADALEKMKAGSFDMALCAFQIDVVPDWGFFLRKGNNENYCRYASTEMTDLIDTLRTQQNQAEFAYTSQEIQQQFATDMPFVCLFYRTGAILTRKMFTTVRTIREFELLRGIEAFGR